ncbi:recombinase RecT [Neiella marina]|uniref:Recombinase RecT n=1 Tax=Neiella holothuriorum TaxID=2870530 RepID=A0ABS7EI61_9GAMM|nr:recombinase RecT [Neiella holothuriorum]MBW8191332.1 recombinase RecT [Neiella holothuriorum]
MQPTTNALAHIEVLRKSQQQFEETSNRYQTNIDFREQANYAHQQIIKTQSYGDFSLLNADPHSIHEAFMLTAILGISLNPHRDYAYLTSRWNVGQGKLECKLEIGYRGYQYLAACAGVIKRADAMLIYSKDDFAYHGPRQEVQHRITSLSTSLEARGEMAGGYCMAELIDGSICTTVMSPEELTAIETEMLAAAGDGFSVWKGPFRDQMRIKTVIRRAWKQWEMLVESLGADSDLMKRVSNLSQQDESDADNADLPVTE